MTSEVVRIGDVLRLERRAVDVDPGKHYGEIGIRSFGKGIFHKEPVSGLDLGNKRVFYVNPGDLVISNVFAWEGAVAIASAAEAGKIGSHRFMTFVSVDSQIDTAWVAWYFRSEAGLDLIRKASPGSAGRNRTLAIDRFEALEIPLPHIADQQRVASWLNGIESAVAQLRRLSECESTILRALAGSLTARSDLTLSTKAKAGWMELTLSDVLVEHAHKVPVRDDLTYNVAGVYSFGRGMFARAELQGSATSYKILHQLRRGQLVMSRLKAWEGAIAVVPPIFDGWFLSPEFPTFDINSDAIDTEFFVSLVTSEDFWGDLVGESRGIGARRERVHASRLLEQRIHVPSPVAQRSTARILAGLRTISDRRSETSSWVGALIPAALNEAFGSLN